MNKELYREQLNTKIINIKLENNELVFEKENSGKITFAYNHEQDCCENVYADFEVINDYRKDILNKPFKEMIIKGIENMGFMICFYQDYEKGKKIFIPCYNEQNGYCSDALELIINDTIKIDISDLTDDNIY